MKTLYLLRHAHSSREDPDLSDQDRPLSSRGRAQARAVGAHMAANASPPDLALISAAARTRETWELMALSLEEGVRVEHREGLYLADPGVLLEEIGGVDDDVRRLLLVAHNPGIRLLVRELAGEGSREQIARLLAGFPSGALAELDFPVEGWSGVAPGAGSLTRYLRPEELPAPG